METTLPMRPCARRANLVVQSVYGELLVYDSAREVAHALNKVAAFVWQQSDGTRTVEEIAQAMTREFGTNADALAVWYALEQLDKKHLLAEPPRPPLTMQGLTRRQFLKRSAAAAGLIAVVATIIAPTPAHAQSSCGQTNAPCPNGNECCPGWTCTGPPTPICL